MEWKIRQQFIVYMVRGAQTWNKFWGAEGVAGAAEG
jgi:hypothetical protein